MDMTLSNALRTLSRGAQQEAAMNSGAGASVPARDDAATNPALHAADPALVALPALTTPAPLALRGPYAAPVTPPIAWRLGLARRWAQWHVGLALAAIVAAVTLIVAGASPAAGYWLFAGGALWLALGAAALRAVEYRAPAAAGVCVLIADLLAAGVALVVLGPQAAALSMLPGALLLAILLVEIWLALAFGAVAFGVYAAALLLSWPAPLAASPLAVLIAVGVGALLFAVALALVAARLRAALAGEAAATYRLTAADRRAAARRAALDADAVALQSALALALRGTEPPPVATAADLAPLAAMLNAATTRVPGLLRDREERLRLERALRDLTAALETAWAGFEWSWPGASGTSVDRLITVLRPANAAPGASFKGTIW